MRALLAGGESDLSRPWGGRLLLMSAIPKFFRVLFTSYWPIPCYSSPRLQLIILSVRVFPFKLLCAFSQTETDPTYRYEDREEGERLAQCLTGREDSENSSDIIVIIPVLATILSPHQYL